LNGPHPDRLNHLPAGLKPKKNTGLLTIPHLFQINLTSNLIIDHQKDRGASDHRSLEASVQYFKIRSGNDKKYSACLQGVIWNNDIME
jgi:hypothetical protein